MIVFVTVSCAGPNKVGWRKPDVRQDQFDKDRKECIDSIDKNLNSEAFGKALEECTSKKAYQYQTIQNVVKRTGLSVYGRKRWVRVMSQDEFNKDRKKCIDSIDKDLNSRAFDKALEECMSKGGYQYQTPQNVVKQTGLSVNGQKRWMETQDEFEKNRKACIDSIDKDLNSEAFGKTLEECMSKGGYQYQTPQNIVRQTGWVMSQDEFNKDRKECIDSIDKNLNSEAFGKTLEECMSKGGYQYQTTKNVVKRTGLSVNGQKRWMETQDKFEKDRKECIDSIDKTLNSEAFGEALEECMSEKGYQFKIVEKPGKPPSTGMKVLAIAGLTAGLIVLVSLGVALTAGVLSLYILGQMGGGHP